jgi:F0F1-type ATP synthase membrane subunit b/b'
MDITNAQFYVAIAVAPVATLVVAVVASMLNNKRADEIRSDLKEAKREVMDRVEANAHRTEREMQELRSELRSDLKEFRAEIRVDLREAVSQIRADLAERRHASGSGGHTG